MKNIPTVDLNVHSLTNTPHKVEEYNGQKVFYSQNWMIDFSTSNNDYKSPIFTEKSDKIFTIFFILSFNDDNDKVSLSGYLVEQTSYQIFKVFFQIGDSKNKNASKNVVWSFNSNKNSNTTEIPDLKKSDIENGWLDENKKLNIYFEISYCDNNRAKLPQKPTQQQKLSQEDIVKKMQQTPGRIGLKNMNSMCYINAFLQVLFHIPKFRQILFSVDTSQSPSKQVLIQTQFLFYMMENSNSPWSAADLANVISFCSNQGNSGKQQDALEFAMKFLDDLEKDLRGTIQENAIKNLFFGLYKHIIKCKNVDFESLNPEPFMSVNIPVHPPEKGNSQELNKSIRQYIKKTEFEYKTDEYGIQTADRWTQFVELPPVLQICFLRSTYDVKTLQLEKKMFPVSFAKTLLLYYTTQRYEDEYRLYAVLSHYGGGDCGHYCVFIRDLPGKKWFKYNDSIVSEVSAEDAIEGNYGEDLKKNPETAYIPYYIRKEDQENLFKTVENNGMTPQMKDFMESLREKKLKEEYEKNNVSFQFILEEKLNSKRSINDLKATYSDKILKIQKSESCFTFYHKVAELFQRDLKEIRLWLHNSKTSSNDFIVPLKKSYLSNFTSNIIFIQNKQKTEKLIPSQINNENGGKIMIFLKYFDTRLKLPIRYIGPILLDKNGGLDVQQICSKLNFNEWTKFYFFIEKTATSVQLVSPGSTFNQGSVVVAQIDKEATALTKLILDKSITESCIKKETIESLKDQITSEMIQNSLPDLHNNPIFKDAEFVDSLNESVPLNSSLDENSELPHYSAEIIIENLKTDLLDYYLAKRFNVIRFTVYDYEHQKEPSFTLDFPSSFKFADMCNIIRKIKKFGQSDGLVLLFNKDQLDDKAAFDFITEGRFTTQIQNKKFPSNRLYFLLAPKITSMNGKLIYNLELAPDGYNVTYRKTIIEKKQITPLDLLKIALKDNKDVSFDGCNLDDPKFFRCFSVYNSTIDEKIGADQIIQSNLHPIRICKFLPPDENEVAVRIYHAIVNKQLRLTFIKEPFYLNLQNGISVDQFKKKVLNGTIKIDNVNEFENAKIEINKVEDHRSSAIFLEKPDDQLMDLKNDSVVYVIYK